MSRLQALPSGALAEEGKPTCLQLLSVRTVHSPPGAAWALEGLGLERVCAMNPPCPARAPQVHLKTARERNRRAEIEAKLEVGLLRGCWCVARPLSSCQQGLLLLLNAPAQSVLCGQSSAAGSHSLPPFPPTLPCRCWRRASATPGLRSSR